MAEEPVTKATEYVILRQIPDRGTKAAAYEVLGWKEGRGARAAVAAFLDANQQEEATFLAVPTSSFNLFESKREQPPPVFRLVEAPTPSGAADETPRSEAVSSGEGSPPAADSGSAATTTPEEPSNPELGI